MDFPRAWQIATEKPWKEHDRRCSFALSEGGLLCDCEVLTRHPEYVADYGDSDMDDLA